MLLMIVFLLMTKAQYQRFSEICSLFKGRWFCVSDNLDFHGMIFDIPNIKNRNTRALVKNKRNVLRVPIVH